MPSEKGDTSLLPPSTPHISPATGRLAAQVAAELARLTSRSGLTERKGLRVLHCDDDDAYALPLAACVARLPEVGEITHVTDGGTALARLQAERFDLIVTDLRHPGLDGHQLCVAAKALYPSMPVVLWSGYASYSLESIRRSDLPWPAPWDAFLRKPTDFRELERVLRVVLGLPERI